MYFSFIGNGLPTHVTAPSIDLPNIPSVSRSSHAQSRPNYTMSREDLKNERHDEMLRVYEERHIVNDSIQQITRPADDELGFLADDIADRIAKDMERLLSPISPNWDKADGSIATRTRSRIANTSTSGAATKHAASGSASLAQDVSNLAISHGKPAQIDA
ncbi:hypothetical protein GGH92_000410, partial [Coemansia sp. RSA 2673]